MGFKGYILGLSSYYEDKVRDFRLGEVVINMIREEEEIRFDKTNVAKLIFSAIYKTQQRFGVNHLVSVLVGSKSQKILIHKHDQITQYGALKNYSFEQVKTWIKELIENRYLEQVKKIDYPIVKLLDKSYEVSTGREEVDLSEPNPELINKWSTPFESRNTTLALFKEGKTVLEIAKERSLAQATIISHLADTFKDGAELDINQFVPSEKQTVITEAFKSQGLEFLSPVKQTLDPSYSWEDLKWFRAKLFPEQQIAA